MRVFTKSGLQIAHNFERIVHGGRGDYIEISAKQIIQTSIYVPEHAEWRFEIEWDEDGKNGKRKWDCYYLEFRSNDISNIMIYLQRRLVGYADYKIHYFYVDPSDVVLKE